MTRHLPDSDEGQDRADLKSAARGPDSLEVLGDPTRYPRGRRQERVGRTRTGSPHGHLVPRRVPGPPDDAIDLAEKHESLECSGTPGDPPCVATPILPMPHHPLIPLALTTRDYHIIGTVQRYRVLTTEHLRRLVFTGSGERVTQARLRRLAEHRFLDRRFFVAVRTGRACLRRLRMPVYVLGPRGRAALGDTRRTGKHAPEATNPEHLQHDLVAVDFLVGLDTALRDRTDLCLAATQTENALRKRAGERVRGERLGLVPDAAAVLRYDGRLAAFALEVVRAGVRGGNRSLRRKLERYADAARSGALAQFLGAPVRAVIVAVPTARRLTELRRALRPSGLIWLTVYQRAPAAGPPDTHFLHGDLLALPMTDLRGRTYSLADPWTPAASAPSPPSHV